MFPSKIIKISNLSAEDMVKFVTLCTGTLKRAESEPMTENLRSFLQESGSIGVPGMTVHSVLNLRLVKTASNCPFSILKRYVLFLKRTVLA